MSIKKISLGTAQWGLKYGVSNLQGKTKTSEVSKILSYASSLGIEYLDTAPSYGNAEIILGKHINSYNFKIITKTHKISKSTVSKNDTQLVIKTFTSSLKNLNLSKVHGLLIHNTNDILVKGSEYLIDALRNLKYLNKVDQIGISIYESKNLHVICERLNPDIVQLPLNILDQRFLDDGSLNFLKEKNIKIHVRSVFLQGLLLYDPLKLPYYFKKWKNIFVNWQKSCKRQKFGLMDAALNYVNSIKEVDYLVIGFENFMQFKMCCDFLKKKNKIIFNPTNLKSDDVNLINPNNWII